MANVKILEAKQTVIDEITDDVFELYEELTNEEDKDE